MMVKMAFPTGDRVLVVREEDDNDMMGGGIIDTPDKVKEKPTRGRVVQVGPGKVVESGATIPVCVKRGDWVLFGKYSGTDIDLGPGQEYTILREDEIMAELREVDEATLDLDASAVQQESDEPAPDGGWPVR